MDHIEDDFPEGFTPVDDESANGFNLCGVVPATPQEIHAILGEGVWVPTKRSWTMEYTGRTYRVYAYPDALDPKRSYVFNVGGRTHDEAPVIVALVEELVKLRNA